MAFLFSSSHLPASRVRRPALDDEDDHENPEAMPRSGGVRASSHVEERTPEHAAVRSAGGSPAAHRGGAGIDWIGRLKELAEQQQRRRADSAPPEEHTWHAEGEPDHDDDDDSPASAQEESPEHEDNPDREKDTERGQSEDTSSWFRSQAAAEEHPPVSAAYDHAAGNPASAYATQRHTVPYASSDSATNSKRMGMVPGSLFFEKRPHPALARVAGGGGSATRRQLGGQVQNSGSLQGLTPNFSATHAKLYLAQAKTGMQKFGTGATHQRPQGRRSSASAVSKEELKPQSCSQNQSQGRDTPTRTDEGEGSAQTVNGLSAGNAGQQGADASSKDRQQLQPSKIIDSSAIPRSQRGLAVLREFFNPGAKNIDELYDSMRKALAGDKALVLHVNSNGGHSAIIAIHLDEKGNLVNTLYDPAGSYTGKKHSKGSGDDLTNELPADAPHEINWSLADYIEHHATDGSMSFVPIWTDGNTARHLNYPPSTMMGFCADSSGKVIQQIPGFDKPGAVGSYFPNTLSDQLFRLTGRKITLQHKQ